MNETPFTPKPYAVERRDYPLNRWRLVDCFETEGEAFAAFGKMYLHRRDKARVRDMNKGSIIGERVGSL